jgi:aminopeptidase N
VYRRPALFLAVLILFPLTAAARAQSPPAEPLRTAGDRPVDIRHIRLDLRVDVPAKTVDARAALHVRSLRPLSSIALDAAEFEVRSVCIAAKDGDEGATAHFAHDGKKLVIDLDPAWPAGREAVLNIDYKVRQPRAGLHFFGPTAAEPNVPLTVWSQGEEEDAHYWFPCLDQPNQRQTTELVVTVADGLEVLSNGKLVERRRNAADKTVTFHWKQDKPHAAYLVTLVVGAFDVVREDWHGLPLLYYVPRGHRGEVAGTFGKTGEMIDLFQKRFGIPYPWDKYAQVVVEQFSAGGMENTSATTLTDRALYDQHALVDGTPEWIIAHELAHQWWGDLVTCRDWAHIWLNEGFASYAEALWAEHSKGADEYAYNMLQKARRAIAGGRDRPMMDRRYPSPQTMFDDRAYPKGAFVLHMLRQRLGDDVFWKGLQRYGTAYRLGNAETADFRKALEAESGRSLERFFYDWTERPGSPALEVTTEYLPQSRLARVVVKQTQSGEPFAFPVALAFECEGPEGRRHVVQEEDVTEREQTLYVPLPGRPVLVEVDPRQAVLAEVKENKGRELWAAQLQRAASVAARVRAAQHFGESRSPADRELLARALPAEKFWGVQAEMAAALGQSGGDTCRDALVRGLSLPEPRVRRACAEALGKFRHDAAAAAALKGLLQRGDPGWTVEAAALSTYARLGQADTAAVLLPWLDRPSHDEYLRTATLSGLGESGDLSCLDTLLAWTRRGKPRVCRERALTALSRLARTASAPEEVRRRMVKAVAACLEGEGEQIRATAAIVLRSLGRSAEPSVPALEALTVHDPSDRVRDLARKAMEDIRKDQPVPVELTRLREELDRVKREQDQLQDRLNRFEKMEHK